jgi:glycosyltransferase involved in cell wall biosynthesis
VVTPSFNQASYLEETLRSVLLQGYPHLEYIVIDGGSTDGSLDLLRRYEPFLDFCRSAPDRGQSDALNTGMSRATGTLAGWVNSDDTYLPGALGAVGRAFALPGVAWVAGACRILASNGTTRVVAPNHDAPLGEWLFMTQIAQPASFWALDLWRRAGGLDETLHFSMDRDLFLRYLLAGARPSAIPDELALFRLHDASKSEAQKNRFRWESATRIVPRYYPRLDPGERRTARRVFRRKLGRLLGLTRP